jgi:hypothetical protein
MMATATRGDVDGEVEGGVVGGVVGDVVERLELLFDFFIRPNIPRPCSNGYFPAHALKSFPGKNPEQRNHTTSASRRERNAQVRH